MTELENKLVEKILEKLDMDKLTDKIAEKAAELIVQKEYPESPVIPPFNPVVPYPWTTPPTPREPITVMYGVVPTQFEVQGGATTSASISTKKEEESV